MIAQHISEIALSLSNGPNPQQVGAASLAAFCRKTDFKFTKVESALLDKVIDKSFTCEPSSVHEIQALRILFWQVVGHLRNK